VRAWVTVDVTISEGVGVAAPNRPVRLLLHFPSAPLNGAIEKLLCASLDVGSASRVRS
jgi:hypothetical protein